MSYTDFIWENFGPLEWLLCIEIIVLLSAGFFYQVAKLIAKTDRHDPLVRFYRVFWQSFTLPVTSSKDLDLAHAEAAARSAGYQFAGDIDDKQLSNTDAPDLNAVAEAERMPASVVREYKEEEPEPASKAASKPAPSRGGRTPPEQQKQAIAKFDARIITGSTLDRLVGMVDGEVVVEVTHEAEDGQANGTIITLIAAGISVPAYQIALLGGHYKVRKTFQVSNIDQATLDRRLANL